MAALFIALWSVYCLGLVLCSDVLASYLANGLLIKDFNAECDYSLA